MTRQLLIYVIALCLIAVGASSCAEKKGDADYSDNIFTEARFIRGHALPDSSVIISVVNPWDTTALLAQYRLVNARIRAFANGGVFNANTAVSRVFEDIAFHPDRVLRDYITIFHNTPDSLLYFHRVATP